MDNQIVNDKYNFENMPREHLYLMVQRLDELLKSRNPSKVYSENFSDIMGAQVDLKMNIIMVVSKLLDQIG